MPSLHTDPSQGTPRDGDSVYFYNALWSLSSVPGGAASLNPKEPLRPLGLLVLLTFVSAAGPPNIHSLQLSSDSNQFEKK